MGTPFLVIFIIALLGALALAVSILAFSDPVGSAAERERCAKVASDLADLVEQARDEADGLLSGLGQEYANGYIASARRIEEKIRSGV